MGYEWKVGELAVCVDDEESNAFLKTGNVYCIRYVTATKNCVNPNRFTGIGLLFFGVLEPIDARTWSSARFRPLNEDDYRRIRDKHGEPRVLASPPWTVEEGPMVLDPETKEWVRWKGRTFRFGPVHTEVGRWKAR